MSPSRIVPRSPQETATSNDTVSRTTSLLGSSAASTSSNTSWDTRVGSPVYSTYVGAGATQTSTTSDGAQSLPGGLLSSKPGVASLCAGIAVLCILTAGFFIYRIKYKEIPKQVRVPDPKSLHPPSVTRSLRAAPSPFQLGSRARHPQRDGVSRSNSPRSLHASDRASSRVLPSRPGDVIDISSLAYQHTNSSIIPPASASAYGSGWRRSENGATGQISDYHPYSLPSRSTERLSSATAVSMVDSSSHNSHSHLISRAQVFTIPYDTKLHPPARRPPSEPPMPPPPTYEQIAGGKSLQILATIADTETRSIADTGALTRSTLLGIQFPIPNSQFHRADYSVGDSQQSGASSPSAGSGPAALTSHTTKPETRSLYGESAFLRRSRRGNDLNLDDMLENDDALDMENAMTPHCRRHCSSGNLEPFSNMHYELPAWLSSDPYPAHLLGSSTSPPSLYGATTRSVAASSRVLPSDSSTRTLTPELTPPPPPPLPSEAFTAMEQVQYTKLRHPHAPKYTTTPPSIRPRSALVGDGPPVNEVLVLHGAERPGWVESSPLRPVTSISRARRHFPADGFEPEDLHPARRNRRSDAPVSPIAIHPIIRSTDRESAFVGATRPSEAIHAQGLSRASSLDTLHRAAFMARNRGRMSRTPGLTRTFSDLSSLHSSSQGARTGIMSTFEGGGRLGNDRLLPRAGLSSATDRGRSSMTASSNVQPSEVASVRSISPEVGWLDPEPPNGHGNKNDHHAQKGGLAVIREAELSGSNHPATPETAANTHASGRASRMSIGEDGILWGRLTSAIERERQSLEQS